jgi:hypothetical protein
VCIFFCQTFQPRNQPRFYQEICEISALINFEEELPYKSLQRLSTAAKINKNK